MQKRWMKLLKTTGAARAMKATFAVKVADQFCGSTPFMACPLVVAASSPACSGPSTMIVRASKLRHVAHRYDGNARQKGHLKKIVSRNKSD